MENSDAIKTDPGAMGGTVVIARSDLPVRDQGARRRRGADLLALAAGLQTGTETAEWRFSQRPGKAPVVTTGPAVSESISVSLAHSGGFFVAAATTAVACGIDIEQSKPRRFDAIAAWLNWPQMVDGFPEHLEAAPFFRLWTLWEATIKLTGNRNPDLQRQVFVELAPYCIVDNMHGVFNGVQQCWSWLWESRFQLAIVIESSRPVTIRIYHSHTRHVLSELREAGVFSSAIVRKTNTN